MTAPTHCRFGGLSADFSVTQGRGELSAAFELGAVGRAAWGRGHRVRLSIKQSWQHDVRDSVPLAVAQEWRKVHLPQPILERLPGLQRGCNCRRGCEHARAPFAMLDGLALTCMCSHLFKP